MGMFLNIFQTSKGVEISGLKEQEFVVLEL